jgi:hypothetical protein
LNFYGNHSAAFDTLVLPILFLLALFLLTQLFVHSMASLVLVPRSLVQIATNRLVKRNHALEHATVNVLEERYGTSRVAGYAQRDGFRLVAPRPIPAEIVLQAAQEGLDRLQRGERKLAIHTRCGTSLLVSNFLFSLLFIVLLVAAHRFSLGTILLAILLAFIISKPLGMMVQKYLTTSTDVKNLYISDIDVEYQSTHPVLILFQPLRYHIRTGYYSRAERSRQPLLTEKSR